MDEFKTDNETTEEYESTNNDNTISLDQDDNTNTNTEPADQTGNNASTVIIMEPETDERCTRGKEVFSYKYNYVYYTLWLPLIYNLY